METNHIKSIFRDGTITKEEYTRAWSNLINQLEKRRCFFSPYMKKQTKTNCNRIEKGSILFTREARG